MATCERKTETPPPPATYVLTLSEREAQALLEFLDGDWAPPIAAALYAVHQALRQAVQ